MDVDVLLGFLMVSILLLAFIIAIVWGLRRRLYGILIAVGGIIGRIINYVIKFFTDFFFLPRGSEPSSPPPEIYLAKVEIYKRNKIILTVIIVLGILLIFVQLIARKRNQKILPPSDAPFAIPKAPDSEH